jgi:GNAT superfamily N-acetyltransferase
MKGVRSRPFMGMRGEYTHGAASLRLSYSMAMPAHMRGGIREVTNVYTLESERGKGSASALLKQVCDEADESGIVLILLPKQNDATGLDDLRLIAWYERNGFISIQDNPILMARQAHGRREKKRHE